MTLTLLKNGVPFVSLPVCITCACQTHLHACICNLIFHSFLLHTHVPVVNGTCIALFLGKKLTLETGPCTGPPVGKTQNNMHGVHITTGTPVHSKASGGGSSCVCGPLIQFLEVDDCLTGAMYQCTKAQVESSRGSWVH